MRDAGKLWNQAPKDIKEAPTLAIAKKKSSSTAKHFRLNPEPEETTEKIGGKTCDYAVWGNPAQKVLGPSTTC